MLLETFTPRESFTFAAKLRTNFKGKRIEQKVDEIVERLGLKDC